MLALEQERKKAANDEQYIQSLNNRVKNLLRWVILHLLIQSLSDSVCSSSHSELQQLLLSEREMVKQGQQVIVQLQQETQHFHQLHQHLKSQAQSQYQSSHNA